MGSCLFIAHLRLCGTPSETISRKRKRGGGRHEEVPSARFFVAALLLGCSSIPPLPPKALELNRLGAAALAAGDFDAAEARLSVALEYSPRFTEAWVNLGYVEMRRGKL